MGSVFFALILRTKHRQAQPITSIFGSLVIYLVHEGYLSPALSQFPIVGGIAVACNTSLLFQHRHLDAVLLCRLDGDVVTRIGVTYYPCPRISGEHTL